MGRQESPQLIERKTQVDTDAQETSRASKYWIWFNDNLHTFVKVYTRYTCSFIQARACVALSGVRRKFSWGFSFSGMWWSFVFRVRCLWRRHL